MSGRLMEWWRWLPLVLLASVWTPACKADVQAAFDPAAEALYYRASFHRGAPGDAEPSICETVCADVAQADTPESTRTTPGSVIDECSLQSSRSPVDRVVRARAQPAFEHHAGPRAVDFGLVYDVVPIGWTGVSATD